MVNPSKQKKVPSSIDERTGKGIKVQRFFTEEGKDPFDCFEYEKRVSKISNPDGSVVFEMKDVEVPKEWSQVATDILAHWASSKSVKYPDTSPSH